MQEKDLQYEYWLAGVRRLSAKKKRKLKEAYGSAKAVYYIEENRLKEQNFLTEEELHALGRRGVGRESEEEVEKSGKS